MRNATCVDEDTDFKGSDLSGPTVHSLYHKTYTVMIFIPEIGNTVIGNSPPGNTAIGNTVKGNGPPGNTAIGNTVIGNMEHSNRKHGNRK